MILRDGPMNQRQILHWFDPDIPSDLPDHVVDKLIDGFWESEIAHRGLTDEVYASNSTQGWNVRLDTLNRRMWYAKPLTVAKYRASSQLPLSDAQRKKLRPWQVAAWQVVNDEKKAARNEAKEKAETLLSTLVSPKQFAHYREFGELMEPSKLHPGKVYILHKGVLAGNIDVYDAVPGRVIDEDDVEKWIPRAVICSSPVESYPAADLILTQVLHIRADEENFLQLANLHTGHWSEAEEAIRDRRPFVTVPRYDKAMGGWVNVPVDLETGNCEYDIARKREAAEKEAELVDQRMEQGAIWAVSVPTEVITDYRAELKRRLPEDPDTTALLEAVQVDEDDDKPLRGIDDLEDVEVAVSFARRWLHKAIKDWLVALGEDQEEDPGPDAIWIADDTPVPALEEAREAPVWGARPVRSFNDEPPSLADLADMLAEGQEAFELVDDGS